MLNVKVNEKLGLHAFFKHMVPVLTAEGGVAWPCMTFAIPLASFAHPIKIAACCPARPGWALKIAKESPACKSFAHESGQSANSVLNLA